jgi:hypothetical protein
MTLKPVGITCSKLLLLPVLVALFSAGCSRPSYSRQEVIDNFKNHEADIMKLADYFRNHKPENNEVFFEPDGNRYALSIGLPGWAIHPDHPNDVGRDMRLNAAKMDTMLAKLKWTKQTVLDLKEMLRKTNCESISTEGDGIRLHYGTSDWSAFGYYISGTPFPDSTIKKDTALGITFLNKYARIVSSGAL